MEQHFLVRVGPPQSLEDLRRSIRQRRPGCQVFAQTDDVSVQRATGRLAVPRDFTETRYAAQSWPRPRRVVARIEATLKGLDTRYVVTNIARGSAQWLYGDVPHQTPDHDSLRHKQEHQKNRAVSFSEKRERPTTPLAIACSRCDLGPAGIIWIR